MPANLDAMMKVQAPRMNRGLGTRREGDDADAADEGAEDDEMELDRRRSGLSAALREKRAMPTTSSTMSRCSATTPKIR
jgi:hypothetical protein